MNFTRLFKKIRKNGSYSVIDDVCLATVRHMAYLLHADDRFANYDSASAFIQLYGIMNNAIDVLRFYADDKKD